MIGKQIELVRRKNGMSQADLARRLHISPSAVGMYEQGRRTPSIDILVAISGEFGVTLDYLVTGKECAMTVPEIETQTDQVMDAISVLKYLSREEKIILLIANLLIPQ